MSSRTSAVVLAAGAGTRMQSGTPKVLHRLRGKTLLSRVLAALDGVSPTPSPIVVVVGTAAEQVERSARSTALPRVRERMAFVLQHEPLGTADACARARARCAGLARTVIVLYGDVPLVTADTLSDLVERHESTGATITLLTADVGDATGYGRVVRGADGAVVRIAEDRQATTDEKAISEINAGVYAFDDTWLWPAIEVLAPAPSGEIYLTDLVEHAAAAGRRVVGILVDDSAEVAGVNTVDELSLLETVLASREAASRPKADDDAVADSVGGDGGQP